LKKGELEIQFEDTSTVLTLTSFLVYPYLLLARNLDEKHDHS